MSTSSEQHHDGRCTATLPPQQLSSGVSWPRPSQHVPWPQWLVSPPSVGIAISRSVHLRTVWLTAAPQAPPIRHIMLSTHCPLAGRGHPNEMAMATAKRLRNGRRTLMVKKKRLLELSGHRDSTHVQGDDRGSDGIMGGIYTFVIPTVQKCYPISTGVSRYKE